MSKLNDDREEREGVRALNEARKLAINTGMADPAGFGPGDITPLGKTMVYVLGAMWALGEPGEWHEAVRKINEGTKEFRKLSRDSTEVHERE